MQAGTVESSPCQAGETSPSQVGNSENTISINLPQPVERQPAPSSPNIKINVTQAAASPGNAGSNLEASVGSGKPFRLTEDGGWIALLVLSIVLVLMTGKSFMMISRVEGLVE